MGGHIAAVIWKQGQVSTTEELGLGYSFDSAQDPSSSMLSLSFTYPMSTNPTKYSLIDLALVIPSGWELRLPTVSTEKNYLLHVHCVIE